MSDTRAKDVECLRSLGEECQLLALRLTRARLTKRLDLDQPLTDASVALARIYNAILEGERDS